MGGRLSGKRGDEPVSEGVWGSLAKGRVVSLVTHADIPDIVWADDETGCYAVWGKDAKGNRIVVERSGPIRIVGARR